MSQRCPFLSHKRTQGRRFPSRQTEKATKQSTQIFILYLNSRSNLGQTMEKWVKSCENQAKYGLEGLPSTFWMCLPPVVGPHSPGVDGILCSEWWVGPPSIYPVYSEYYIPRSRHGAASHISQTSGFLHLLTSGQQPHTSSTPSAFTGVHKCWWRRLISRLSACCSLGSGTSSGQVCSEDCTNIKWIQSEAAGRDTAAGTAAIKSSNEDECFLVSLPVFSMRQSLSHSVTDGPIYWWRTSQHSKIDPACVPCQL